MAVVAVVWLYERLLADPSFAGEWVLVKQDGTVRSAEVFQVKGTTMKVSMLRRIARRLKRRGVCAACVLPMDDHRVGELACWCCGLECPPYEIEE